MTYVSFYFHFFCFIFHVYYYDYGIKNDHKFLQYWCFGFIHYELVFVLSGMYLLLTKGLQ